MGLGCHTDIVLRQLSFNVDLSPVKFSRGTCAVVRVLAALDRVLISNMRRKYLFAARSLSRPTRRGDSARAAARGARRARKPVFINDN
jgi:hypothetical protein